MMKTFRTACLIPVCAMALAACSTATDQDPFKGQSQSVRNGVPPELNKLPPPAKPITSEALRLDTLDYVDFREGVEGQILVKGRVLKPDTNYVVQIENLVDFPGARVEPIDPADPEQGLKFIWTPPEDFASSEFVRKARLETSIHTLEAPILSVRKTVGIFVTRKTGIPEIVSVEDLTGEPLREGEFYKFQIVVRDPDGADTEPGRPKLVFAQNRKDRWDISSMVGLDPADTVIRDPKDPKQWIFTGIVDLSERELTRHEETFTFAVGAISRYGAIGARRNVDVKVRTSVREPVTSWKEPVTVFSGEEVVFNFHVADPFFEGDASVLFLQRPEHTLGVATWDCPLAADKLPSTCTIRWKVPVVLVEQTFEVPYLVRNLSRVTGDKTAVEARMIGKFIVKPAPPKATPSSSLNVGGKK